MKKFPVISENGIEYLVEIRNPLFDYFAVRVFIKKTIFGITYNSLINGEEIGGTPWYSGNKYDFNYVEMAKDEIVRIETVDAEIERRELLRKLGASKFEEWDGNCSDK